MGACKNYSRWGLIWAASLLAVSSSGCTGYALRPVQWLAHNTIPSACKTCPGGLPGPGGCRSFENPWCAGYETTLWQHLGKNCGPARLPSALASMEEPSSSESGSASGGNQEDAAPELPDAFPNPLPEPGNLPPALPDLPSNETDLPPTEDFPFPVKPVPSSPPDEEPTNPLRDPSDSSDPTVSPDLFPESKPKTPSGEKKPAPTSEKSPPLVVPEKIDDLFNQSEKTEPDDSAPADSKLPNDFPSFENGPSPKQPEALPEPERKTPMSDPEPKLFDQNEQETSPPPREPNRIPALPPLNGPNKESPAPKSEPDDSEIPKLFEDSSIQLEPEPRLQSEDHSTLRFGRVIQTSAEEDPILRVNPAGGTVDLGGGFYGAGQTLPGPPQPLLRIKQ